MGELLMQLLPELAGLLITPGAVIGCVLLLQSQRPLPNAASFGGGFVVVYSMIAISALLGGASEPGSTSPDVSHGAGLVVGLLFLALGCWMALRRPRPVTQRPRLLSELETAGPRKAFVIGIALGVINPNLFIMMAGMSAISSSDTGVAAALLTTLLLLLAASLDFLIPMGIYAALGERARTGLDTVQAWMLRHSRMLSLGVLFGFGALFTLRGLAT
ncbi:GAP family protein [Nocardia inohanensis]|uniref:GAP family protein n=1 Tax=Nocardia inohanensis TaxID=209246 RepID=UPI00082CD7E2|nr:GAP family protein [Nocardia inohanensis]